MVVTAQATQPVPMIATMIARARRPYFQIHSSSPASSLRVKLCRGALSAAVAGVVVGAAEAEARGAVADVEP